MNRTFAHAIITRGVRPGAALLCLSLVVGLCQTQIAYGWSAKRDLKPRWSQSTTPIGSAIFKSIDESALPAEIVPAIDLPAPLAVSSVPKRFWFECGLTGDCTNASLYYVDPAAATPVKTLFASGVTIVDDNNQSIPSGTLNTSTYQLSNLKAAYVLYFKDGRIYSADTTTLTRTQLSSETRVTADQLCGFTPFVDWKTPLNSTVSYQLSGMDSQCWTGDDVRAAVKLSMTALSTPIALPGKQVNNQLFDGTYLVTNWSVYPGTIQRCQSNLTTCANILTFSGNSRGMDEIDAGRVLFMDGGTWGDGYTGGTLRSYRYNVTPAVLTNLYAASSTEMVAEAKLDRDGFVYFITLSTVAPYTGKVRKVPYGGGTVTTLHTFALPGPVSADSVWLELSPSYIVANYPNATSGTAVSVNKSTGVVTTLSSGYTHGGVIGGYLYYEDALARVGKVALNGTGLVSKPNTQLIGASFGGSADYHYGFNTLTCRMFLKDASNAVRSYAFSDNISVATAGIPVGTIPANLSNAGGNGFGYDVLLVGEKRNVDFSFGTDILYFKATTASTLKRMTNASGLKGAFSDWLD